VNTRPFGREANIVAQDGARANRRPENCSGRRLSLAQDQPAAASPETSADSTSIRV
jgi:hypothetical protein